MDRKILITWAAFNRSPAAATEIISLVLRSGGLLVDCIPIRSLPEVEHYSAVVIGGNVRFGQVHSDMSAFIYNYQAELSLIPAACFVINNTLAQPSAARTQVIKNVLDQLCARVSMVKPISTAAFFRQTSYMEPFFPRKTTVDKLLSTPGDNPWVVRVQSWAESLLPKLLL